MGHSRDRRRWGGRVGPSYVLTLPKVGGGTVSVRYARGGGLSPGALPQVMLRNVLRYVPYGPPRLQGGHLHEAIDVPPMVKRGN